MQNRNDDQIELINKFKNYLVKFEKNYYEPEKNSIFYPATYSECIGSYILSKKHHKKKGFFKNLKIVLSDVLYSLKYKRLEEVEKKCDLFYDRLIVTWAFRKNFKKDGSIDDRYFNIIGWWTFRNSLYWYI